jgi:YggT family protein
MFSLLALVINAYTLVVVVAVVLSWLNLSPDNPVVRVTRTLTEPVLEPIRKILPPMGGFDLSPMILLLGLCSSCAAFCFAEPR